MKTFFYLLLIISAFGCNSKASPSGKEITSEVKAKPQVEVRNFAEESHLFLGFYAGMNREEVKETLKEHIGQSDILRLKKTSNKPIRVDRENLMEISESSIDSLSFFPGFEQLYYKFSNGTEVYYALLEFEFASYSSLGKISLLLPDNIPQRETSDHKVKEQFEKSKLLSSSIHKLYRQKYGTPTIEKGNRSRAAELFYEIINAKEIYERNFHYFEDISRYRKGNKLIEITHSLDAVRIVYLLNSDHVKMKHELGKEFKEQQGKREEIYQKTIESI